MIPNKMVDIKSGDNILIASNYSSIIIINIITIDEDKSFIRIQSKHFPDGKRKEPSRVMYKTIQ
jgi:hypothetical protein